MLAYTAPHCFGSIVAAQYFFGGIVKTLNIWSDMLLVSIWIIELGLNDIYMSRLGHSQMKIGGKPENSSYCIYIY